MQGDQMWKGLPDPGTSKAKTEWWDKAGAGGQPVSHWMNFNRDSSADGIGLTFQRVLQSGRRERDIQGSSGPWLCLHRWWEAPGVQAGTHLCRGITRERGGCRCPSRRVHCPFGPGP